METGTIEVRVAELRQLFNEIDPAPFREKDLDPSAEEFIVGWANEMPRDAELELAVHVDREPAPEQITTLRDAVHSYFANRALHTRRRLRRLFRLGRISLAIGIVFLVLCIGIGDFIGSQIARKNLANIIAESLLIGGWVAMWRPLEVFLYDWWPISAEAKLYDRLARMPVNVGYESKTED
jgi:hypothetical protein